jgi:hypothetical protein
LCQAGASFGFACKISSIPMLAAATLPGGAAGGRHFYFGGRVEWSRACPNRRLADRLNQLQIYRHSERYAECHRTHAGSGSSWIAWSQQRVISTTTKLHLNQDSQFLSLTVPFIRASHSTQLHLRDSLPTTAGTSHVFQSFPFGGSPLSIGQLCDHGCAASFNSNGAPITN